MPDCTITEIRDLLPDFARGALDERQRAMVGVHVASCAACTRELELLGVAQRALSRTPAVDVGRIVAALPKPPAAARPALRVERGAGPAPTRVAPRRSRAWTGVPMRIAAAIAVMAVGGMGLRIATGGDNLAGTPGPRPTVPAPVIATAPTSPATAAPDRVASAAASPSSATPSVPTTRPTKAPAPAARSVSFGGGLSDLSDGDLQSLLGELEALDALPSAEPEPTVTPVTTGTI